MDRAEGRHWEFEKVHGEMGMFQRLVNGAWSESEFLIVPPGCRVAATYDEGVIAVEPLQP